MSTTTVDQNDRNSVFGRLIANRIAECPQQRITFAEFMDWALYDPQYGYYATRSVDLGDRGDFFTSSHLGSDLGELLAIQFVQMWEILQHPCPFALVEMGAGQGILAADVLRYLQHHHPDFYCCLEYIIVEKSATLRAEQQRQLQPLLTAGLPIRWCSFEEIPSGSIVGCCFSNELVDAFPVHLITISAHQLQEIYVTATPSDAPQFREVVAHPSTDRLAAYLNFVGIDLQASAYADGYRSEINLAALDWLSAVVDRLQYGYVLTIDYGYPADRYYHPMRDQGTLQCYYQHAHHSDPYLYIGQQDITAHVDFTALERQGDRCGLQTVGRIPQGLFLMALGLGDRIAALGQSQATDPASVQAALQRRQALHQLIDMSPAGLGNFNVLIQSKAVPTPDPLLKGLSLPLR